MINRYKIIENLIKPMAVGIAFFGTTLVGEFAIDAHTRSNLQPLAYRLAESNGVQGTQHEEFADIFIRANVNISEGRKYILHSGILEKAINSFLGDPFDQKNIGR